MYNVASSDSIFFKNLMEVCFLKDLYNRLGGSDSLVTEMDLAEIDGTTFASDLRGMPETVCVLIDKYADTIKYSVADTDAVPKELDIAQYADLYKQVYKFIMDERIKYPCAESILVEDAFEHTYEYPIEMIEFVMYKLYKSMVEEECFYIFDKDEDGSYIYDDNYEQLLESIVDADSFEKACLTAMFYLGISDASGWTFDNNGQQCVLDKEEIGVVTQYLFGVCKSQAEEEYKFFCDEKPDDEAVEDDAEGRVMAYKEAFSDLFDEEEFTSTFFYDEDFRMYLKF